MAQVTDELAGVRHFRQGRGLREQRTTTLELFFDLVFVFAVTQLSHALLEHLTWAGAARTLFLLLLVWWAWNYTTWMTDFVDPDSPLIRLMLLAVMLASLLMAIAIPEAFGDRAALFALSYAAIQLIRNVTVTALAPRGSASRATFEGILAWSAAAAALLVAGAFMPYDARVAVWVLALLVDLAGPVARYRLPGRAAVSTDSWAVSAGHFAERFQLFVIIALGESIVVTGATASGLDIDAGRAAAIAVAFAGTAALWWLYFDRDAAAAGRRLEAAGAASGALARDAFTYLHIPVVAGIILVAVGDELVIAHPGDQLDAAGLVALAAGPVLFLAGLAAVRLRLTGRGSGARLAAAAAIAVCGLAGAGLAALTTAALMLAVLVALAARETLAGTG